MLERRACELSLNDWKTVYACWYDIGEARDYEQIFRSEEIVFYLNMSFWANDVRTCICDHLMTCPCEGMSMFEEFTIVVDWCSYIVM